MRPLYIAIALVAGLEIYSTPFTWLEAVVLAMAGCFVAVDLWRRA